MSGVRPELICVTGPQLHSRAVLMKNSIILGRSPQVDICINEQFISRQQAQMTLTQEGWVIESLSKNSMFFINGKKYNPGKKIIIETGDIIKLGQETELLFVDSNAIPDQVLAEYRQTHPEPAPRPVAIPTPQPEPEPERPKKLSEQDLSQLLADQPTELIDIDSQGKPTQPVFQQKGDQAEELSPEEQAELARKAKFKKYIIGFGIYAIIMVVGIFALSTLKSGNNTTGNNDAKPVTLTHKQIETLLFGKLVRQPNTNVANIHLKQANRLFVIRNGSPENLYLCVLRFKLFDAFANTKNGQTLSNEEEKNFDTAKKELLGIVTQIYDNITFLEEGKTQWAQAKSEVEYLETRLPYTAATNPDFNDIPTIKLHTNIKDHHEYISHKLFKQQKKKR